MQVRTQGVRAAATVLVAGLLVTGCTGDPAPVATSTRPSATAAPTPSPTPTPTLDATVPPERPEAMATPNADGAAAAASYAIDVLNHASASGDVGTWTAIVAPTCRMCVAFADDIRSSGADHSSTLTVTSASGREVDAGRLYTAEVTVTQSASSDGTVPAGHFVFDIALGYADDWSVEAIDIREA